MESEDELKEIVRALKRKLVEHKEEVDEQRKKMEEELEEKRKKMDEEQAEVGEKMELLDKKVEEINRGDPQLSEDKKNTVNTDLDNALCNDKDKATTKDILDINEDHNDEVLAMPSPLLSWLSG